MRTKQDVQKYLSQLKADLKHTQDLFDEYDNHDDMEEIEHIEAKIEAIEWVLKG